MLASAMLATMFTGCGDSSTTDSNAVATTGNDAAATTTEAADTDAAKTDAAGGSVYYLNFKPEQADQWKELAEKYTEETGNLHRADRCSSNGYHSSRRYLRADVKVRDRQG